GTNGTSLGLHDFRRKPRKKPPIQLCPVPGCTERAAPIFGMVCAKHKDLPKAKIKKYREARRALKAKGRARRPAAAPKMAKAARAAKMAKAAKAAKARKVGKKRARRAPAAAKRPAAQASPPPAPTATA